MQSVPEDSQPEEEFWLICPICEQPNPAGTQHCSHCWGAALHSVKPISSEELAEVTRQRQAYLKRLRLFKGIAVGLGAPLMLFAAVLLGLYAFTDIAFAPLATLDSSPVPGEWTMFRRDLGHSGSINLSEDSPQGTLKWVFSTGVPIHSSATVVDGTVYIGSRDFKLYALDAETGTKRWEFTAESWVESSPTVVSGVVYFGSNDGKLHALDARTGRELWDFDTQYPIRSSPAVADGMIYIGSDDDYIHALDAVTGTKLWDFETRSRISSSPAVANGILYVGSIDGRLYALDAQSGRFRLQFRAHQPFFSSPAVSDGVVYINSSDGYLYALDGYARNWPGEKDFRPYWIQFYTMGIAPPPPPMSGYLWRLRLGLASWSSPVATGDTVYTTVDNRLYSIDAGTRERRWVFPTEGTLQSSPALGDNALYIGSEDGHIYAVDAITGEPLWENPFRTGGMVTSSPTLADGTIYVGSHDGKVYAIE